MTGPFERWLVRVTRFEPDGNGVMVPPRTGPELARRLARAPVRGVWHADHLVHPRHDVDPRDPAHLVGVVVRAWVEGDEVRAVLALTDGRWQRALCAMARDGVLGQMGVSLAAAIDFDYIRSPDGRDVKVITGWRVVHALDFTDRPAVWDACVLRSIPVSTVPTSPPPLERSLACQP